MLPNFLIIGAAKGGTTSLYEYLRAHPQVFMSTPKELRFFTVEHEWDRGLDWYEAQFADAGDALAVGEASVAYSRAPHYDGVPERIAKVLPDVRLVYVLRDPIERMRAQYQQHVLAGREHRPIESALLEDSYNLDTSRYAMQIERYLEHVPWDRLLTITSEDLRERRAATLRAVHRFIGVREDWRPPNLDEEFNTWRETRTVRPVDEKLRKLPGYRGIAQLLPMPVKRLKHWLTTKGMQPEPEVSIGLRCRLEGQLRDDVRRLYAYMQPGFDGWGIV
jgi:sulfotransferase family protein